MKQMSFGYSYCKRHGKVFHCGTILIHVIHLRLWNGSLSQRKTRGERLHCSRLHFSMICVFRGSYITCVPIKLAGALRPELSPRHRPTWFLHHLHKAFLNTPFFFPPRRGRSGVLRMPTPALHNRLV